jgi:rod shape-determining protein MreB
VAAAHLKEVAETPEHLYKGSDADQPMSVAPTIWAVAPTLAIDVGTSMTRVATESGGLVFAEPTVVAIDTRDGSVVALGHEAVELVGRTLRHVVAFRPMHKGATTDFDVAARLLHGVLDRCGMGRFSRPRVLLTVPAAATAIERRALRQAARRAGAAHAHLLEAPIAAAIGMGLPIHDPVASSVAVAGAGTTEVAVISLGGIVSLASIRIGGDDLDADISAWIRQHADAVITGTTAEALKMSVGTASEHARSRQAEVPARRTTDGAPFTLVVSGDDVHHAIADHVHQIVRASSDCLADAPPDLAQDVLVHGMHVVGGGSMLDGIVEQLCERTEVPVHTCEAPAEAVVLGAGRCLEDLGRLSQLFASAER